MYIPKSNINISHANKGELIYRHSKEPYEGYYIETADGRYFKGNNPLNLEKELIKEEDYAPKSHSVIGSTDNTPSFGTSMSNKKYKILKPNIHQKLETYRTIIGTKTRPLKADYLKGWYRRYFVNRINDSFNYQEISFDVFTKINDRTSKYDPNLYRAGYIKWSLKSDSWKTNGMQLNLLRKQGYSNIHILFPNLIEFQTKKSYNITNRTYPNGENIPPTLPPTYGLPKFANQQCGNCTLNQEGHCSKWNAHIRSNYWCKSWYPINLSHNQFSLYGIGNLSFDDFLNNYMANQPIYGCTDESATNYNSGATTDDGSCYYNTDFNNTDPELPLESGQNDNTSTGAWSGTEPIDDSGTFTPGRDDNLY